MENKKKIKLSKSKISLIIYNFSQLAVIGLMIRRSNDQLLLVVKLEIFVIKQK